MARLKAIGFEKYSDTLFEMRAYITETDRLLAMEKFDFGEQTMSRYLNKKGSRIDLALSLIEFFKERIAARDSIAVWVPPLKSDKHIAKHEDMGVA